MSLHTAVNDVASLFQTMRIDQSRDRFKASKKSIPITSRATSPFLLNLPNELLSQAAGYLVPTERICKTSGFGFVLEQQEHGSQEATRLRRNHAQSLQNLLNLGLTCKRLADVAQTILYRDVSLCQPRRDLQIDKRSISAFPSFLRTIILHPELAAYVRHLAVWIFKNKPVYLVDNFNNETACACESCLSKLNSIMNTLELSHEDKTSWLKDLKRPTEVIICSLILASLPNLRTLQIYARPLHPETLVGDLRSYGSPLQTRTDTLEITRLSRGLATSKHLTYLTLSPHLNGLATYARLPTLTSLTVDFSSAHQFVSVPKSSFRNVTHLRIQAHTLDFLPTSQSAYNDTNEIYRFFQQKLDILLRGLRTVRTLEFESGAAASRCNIPDHVEKVVLRPAEWDARQWVGEFLEGEGGGNGVRRIEVYWRDDWAFPPVWRGVGEVRSGIQVVFFWRGDVKVVLK
ncbi:Nn.00g107510.m01.CDS01 [Neocucurbitaria sp. VM-36]